jgi:threonine dehydratase
VPQPTLPLRDFLAARRLIGESFPPTPLQPAPGLGERYGVELWTKHENLTPVRSFKVRGALWRLSLLDDAGRAAGVVTSSTGNHGMGIAYAARHFGTSAVVVVPEGASAAKVARARALGAEVREQGATLTESLAIARETGEREGRVFVEDGDDAGLMVGAGTIALEVLTELPQAEVLVVPVGGGNLIAGIAACAKQLQAEVEVVGVQSDAADAVERSFRERRVVRRQAETYAGGLAADYPGELALSVVLEQVDDVVLVGEDDLRRATALALDEVGQVLEGAGAASLAGLARHGSRWQGRRVVAVLSGGNADRAELRAALG